MTADEERAAIVSWLRDRVAHERAEQSSYRPLTERWGVHGDEADVLAQAADEIERGKQHRGSAPKDGLPPRPA